MNVVLLYIYNYCKILQNLFHIFLEIFLYVFYIYVQIKHLPISFQRRSARKSKLPGTPSCNNLQKKLSVQLSANLRNLRLGAKNLLRNFA